MTYRVELVYDRDCPNVEAARVLLRQAFTQMGIPAVWQEWDRNAPESPVYARHYGSPTILVNGLDVAGVDPSDGADCCRIYQDEHRGLRGVPTLTHVVTALLKENEDA
jgi:hypothetical protein